MRSLYIALIYFGLLVLGFETPFILTLGYVWTDVFKPNTVSYTLLNSFPVSMVMGIAAIGGYFILDRRDPPQLNGIIFLTLTFAVWVTLTTTWAAVPDAAWAKWNWAFKTVAFSAFVPFVIRSRTQIEALLLVYVFSLAANVIPFGLKTMLSGGGYGRALALVGGNGGLSESSTLAAVSVSMIPLLLFLKDHGRVLPRTWPFQAVYLGMIGACVAATIGTYARTGLIGLAIVGVHIWVRSRHKVLLSLAGAVVVLIGFQVLSGSWRDRMSTIGTYRQDDSALARILVWEWTWNYALDHPFGGGFDVYRIDKINLPEENSDGSPTSITKAFHSIYFEVLGEQGFVGLGLFLGIAGLSMIYCRRAGRMRRDLEELQWAGPLGAHLLTSLIVVMVCGSFIGIAFQPILYYLFCTAASLNEYVRRVRREETRASTRLASPIEPVRRQVISAK